MSQEKKQVVKEEKNNNKVWIVVLAVVLLAVNGIQGFFNYKQNDEIKQQAVTIQEGNTQRDSLSAALTAKIEELKAISAELAEKGAKNEELLATIASLEETNERLKKDEGYRYKYNQIKSEIDNANKLKDEAKAEVAALKIQLNQKDSTLNIKNAEIVQKTQTINTLEEEKGALAQKVAVASVLKAENIKVISVSSKGKEKIDDAYKGKSLGQIKILFTVAENKIAPKNTKELFIRIVEPDGATITGSSNGEFKYNTQTLFYTTKTSILYNGLISPVTVSYTKEGAWKVGKHTIEVYCEGSLIGTGTFVIS